MADHDCVVCGEQCDCGALTAKACLGCSQCESWDSSEDIEESEEDTEDEQWPLGLF